MAQQELKACVNYCVFSMRIKLVPTRTSGHLIPATVHPDSYEFDECPLKTFQGTFTCSLYHELTHMIENVVITSV